MTKTEKQQFVRDLMAGITETILSKIDAMPEVWDGHELRMYILDKTNENISWMTPDRKRKRDYKNFVLVNNL